MTYQILLVDDEAHAIEGVKSDLDLNKLGITGLFTANNIRQAKEVFEREYIDIMLCDIEMPKGNGLELLEWVREHHPITETIFLTSHADFKYARAALQLGSLDYLLKPVRAADLEGAIRKAQSAIDRSTEINKSHQFHQFWVKHHSLIIEHFWFNLVNHSTTIQPAAVRELIERHHIPFTEESIFLPILISVHRWNKPLKRSDEKILEYALKNTAEEIILNSHGNGICFHLEPGMLLVIVSAEPATEWSPDRFQEACLQYINACHRYFYCDLSCYIGRPVQAHEMAEIVADLRVQDRNNVAFENQVHTYLDTKHSDRLITLPDSSVLSSLLKAGKKEAVIHELESYLAERVRDHGMDARALHQINQSFMQMLYSHLNSKGIQANQLFGDDLSKLMAETAGRSVTDTMAWVEHAVGKAMNQSETIQETDTLIQTVKQYIALNIDQDLSREMVAEQVFLHPDHLTRIFKKHTGQSIFEYIILKRIRIAKELLLQTDNPISDIATAIGYSSFSHFSKLFKKYTDLGPNDYRNHYRGK
ncbi:hypothetical protein P40081_27745 [Paenibacillus sp. FSL P4-0081]|uniref:response regulator n=1 Tax=unclassified Paenibacillus TaxID=185978 RepID=UPI0004F791B6|nr:response regulator [Paenibacillus sp. FSL P4-0081]AIQ31522.1 hypothetical protein P40081_27745 [Paenibacillus sp. FSL P4-0081]